MLSNLNLELGASIIQRFSTGYKFEYDFGKISHKFIQFETGRQTYIVTFDQNGQSQMCQRWFYIESFSNFENIESMKSEICYLISEKDKMLIQLKYGF